jgi:hypothetical protein
MGKKGDLLGLPLKAISSLLFVLLEMNCNFIIIV